MLALTLDVTTEELTELFGEPLLSVDIDDIEPVIDDRPVNGAR
jgi:hypothetical protein